MAMTAILANIVPPRIRGKFLHGQYSPKEIMMSSKFAISQIMVGQLNAMVKNLMFLTGINDPAEAVRQFNSEEWRVEKENLFKKVDTVSVGGVERFFAQSYLKKAHFILPDRGNFQKFLAEKVEENVGDATISIHHLERASSDAAIMSKLGDLAEIKLAHFLELIKAQSKGEAGILLVNGSANIAYIRDEVTFKIWAVYAGYVGATDHWVVHARSVESFDGWWAGNRVISRDS